MVTQEEIIRFCYRLPRGQGESQCAWAIALELAHLFSSPDEKIVITNRELSTRIGYSRQSVVNQKDAVAKQGYWQPLDGGLGKPSAWLPTKKLIDAVISERAASNG